MAKKDSKTAAPSAAPSTVKCSICSEEVALNDYATHIQQKHASSSSATAVPRAAIPSTPMPPFPGGAPAFQPQPQGQPGGQGPLGGGPRPFTGPIRAGDYAGVPYLKGSDLPVGVSQVKVKIIQWVYVPGQRSPLACQIEKVYEKELLGINKTNIKQLITLGFPELSVLVGRTLVLGTYPVNNPTTGQLTVGLWIQAVE